MSNRINLREFQADLTSRLLESQEKSTSDLLGFQAKEDHWLINLSDSGEVLPLTPISPVPLTKDWFLGLTNIRGNLYAVTDFSLFQGKGAITHNAHSRLLLIGTRFGSNVALLVTRILGLRHKDNLTLDNMDSDAPPWIGEVFTDNEGVRWKTLNAPLLLADKRFMDIGL